MLRHPIFEVARTLLHPGPESADYGETASDGEWLRTDWSLHLRSMQVRERRVTYVDMGDGPETLVFIHGLGACWQTWLEQLPRFARTHRCIAMDLPGFGRSEMPRDDISMEAYAQIVAEMCKELGVERATVVGNSMGGFVGAELAIRRPELVDKLVLVSAAVFWQEYRRARPLVALARSSEATVGRAVVHGQKAIAVRPRIRAAALTLGGFRYPHLLGREMQMELLIHARRTAGFVPALMALASFPLREELPKIACPTLIVWGTDDTLVSVRHAKELARLIPDAEKVIFERTGHIPMIERPQRFNAALEAFLAAGERTTAAPGVTAGT